MIDKADDDPFRVTRRRSSGSNFPSFPLPGNWLYLETVSETTQLRRHPAEYKTIKSIITLCQKPDADYVVVLVYNGSTAASNETRFG
jgi:hypothetical protein